MIHDNIEIEVSITVRDIGGYPVKIIAGSKQVQAGSMTFADMRVMVNSTVQDVNNRVLEALTGAGDDETAQELEFLTDTRPAHAGRISLQGGFYAG